MNAKQFLPAVIATVLLASSCKPGSEKVQKPQAEKPSLSGRYVNQTFLDEMSDSLGFTPRYYCLQMHFVDSARVFIDRGFEGDTLDYIREGDSFKLVGASSLGDMSISTAEDGRLVLNDSAFTGTGRRSSFARLEEGQDAAKAWTRMINERMASGEYEIIDKGKTTGKKASLSPDGSVTGLADYVAYELCYTGDCLQTTMPYRNIMYLIKADGTRDTFAYNIGNGRKGLQIFAVGDPIPGTKGERKVLGIVHDLRKI